MSITERQVITALQSSVISAVAQSTMPSIPMDFININFTPPDNNKWIETIYLPNPPSDSTWGNERIYRGFYRIILHWPNDGGGSYDAADLAESIMSKFDKGVRLNKTLNLLNQPRVVSMPETEKELVFVISLEYSSFSW